jgi:hypothetical protein
MSDWIPGLDYPESVHDRERRLERALRDLIDAAESRVPGDDAIWSEAITEAKRALEESPEQTA